MSQLYSLVLLDNQAQLFSRTRVGVSLPPSLLLPAAFTGSGKGRGSQCFAWAQAHIALFLLDCIIGPCRQRLISHCEFPTKVAWVLGGVEPEEKLLPGATWSPRMAVREATWGKFKEPGLWKSTDWAWAELFTGQVPWGWWSNLQASVCSSVKQGYATLLTMVGEITGLKSLYEQTTPWLLGTILSLRASVFLLEHFLSEVFG